MAKAEVQTEQDPGSWYALARDASGNEQRLGPVAFAELVHLLEFGRLGASDLVWHPDFAEWKPAREVEGLFAKPREPKVARGVWPSDALPLWILAGIVACFVLHFGQRRFEQSAEPSASAATVEVEICNRTALPKVYATVAYYDPFLRDWVARGWYAVPAGTCKTPLKNLKPPVFVFAESQDGRTQFGAAADGVDFCIDGAAAFVTRQRGCSGRRAAFQEWKTARWEIGP